MEYSNYGFILLGRLIELVSGESYESYVREHVFMLRGIAADTDSRPEIDRVEGAGIGYTTWPNGLGPTQPPCPGAEPRPVEDTPRSMICCGSQTRSGR